MSSVIRPVGPQPPSVYWVRRVLALLVVVAVVAAAIWLVTGRGADTPTATPGPTGSPTPDPVTSPSPSPSPSHTKKASSSPTATKSPTSSPSVTSTSAAPLALCKDADISVTASTDAATYPVGATPRLRMRIMNTSKDSCRRDVGAAANELIVNKGSTRFWSSDDCNPPGKADVVTLAAGQSYSVTLGWLGHASQPKCPANQPAATAGSYNLVGRNGDLMSKPEPFSLT